jgi:hypothetical protein
MNLAVSTQLYAYWDGLRAGRSAPERNDIEPGAIRAILGDTFVLDFDKQSGFPFRIAGSRGNTLFLQELRGLSFLELWREADRREVKTALQRVANETRPYLLCAEARPPGLEALVMEAALLPLRHHGSTHSRILGSFAMTAAPPWLGLVGAGPVRLKSLCVLELLKPPVGVNSAPPARGISLSNLRAWRERLPLGWRNGRA